MNFFKKLFSKKNENDFAFKNWKELVQNILTLIPNIEDIKSSSFFEHNFKVFDRYIKPKKGQYMIEGTEKVILIKKSRNLFFYFFCILAE